MRRREQTVICRQKLWHRPLARSRTTTRATTRALSLAVALGLAAAIVPVAADAQVPYQVGDGNPSVTVDLGVLNDMGRAQNVPGLLNRGLRGGYAPGMAPVYSQPGYGVAPGAAAPGGAVIGRQPQIPTWLRRDGSARPAPAMPPAAAPRPSAPSLATAPQLRRPSSGSTATSAAAPTLTPPKAAPKPAPKPTATASSSPAPAAPKAPAPAVPPAQKPAAKAPATASAPPPPPKVPEAPKVPPPPPPAAASNPAPAPAPPPAPKEQVASAPATAPTPAPAAAPSAQGATTTRVIFPAGESQVPDAAKAAMLPVIDSLKGDDTLRLQLKAFAAGGGDSANSARRLSLSRALAVRAYLIDNEIASTRMDVRALGDRSEGGPADRVDLVVVPQ